MNKSVQDDTFLKGRVHCFSI